MNLELKTVSVPDVGTFGRLYVNGEPKYLSVEREWLDNKPSISCIPEGTYRLTHHNSPKFGPCYALVNEDLGVSIAGDTQRTHILIHPANKPSELQGCIALGYDWANSYWGAHNSRKAVLDFERELAGKGHTLKITREYI